LGGHLHRIIGHALPSLSGFYDVRNTFICKLECFLISAKVNSDPVWADTAADCIRINWDGAHFAFERFSQVLVRRLETVDLGDRNPGKTRLIGVVVEDDGTSVSIVWRLGEVLKGGAEKLMESSVGDLALFGAVLSILALGT